MDSDEQLKTARRRIAKTREELNNTTLRQRLTSQWQNRHWTLHQTYRGPTDKHQHLLHSSCHTIHTKRAIPFNLALRLRRICSTNETFTLRTNELIDYLHKRGYNRYFLQREIQRVNNITRTEALTPLNTSTLDKPERVPFVITYNSVLRSISSIIRKHFHILISSPVAITSLKLHPL